MSVLPYVFKSAGKRQSLIAVVAISLAALCATGIAAFAGVLPASEHVAVAMTTTPLIDMQADASAAVSRSTH
jgi:hypothetical protein